MASDYTNFAFNFAYLRKGPLAVGIGGLLLGINLAPDFILSLKLECSSGRFYLTSDELNRRSVQFPECVLIVP